MTTPFIWLYAASAANMLTTELNSIANSNANVLSAAGATIDNSTNGFIYCDLEFLAGGTLTPVSGAFVEVWFLRSLNGGTNFEDGSATVAPGRLPDATIQVRAGTTITPRSGASGIILPPGHFKPILRNQTGVTLPASGNLLTYRPYNENF